MAFVLRSYWRSSCSWRVRIALNIKGIPYEAIPVHLVNDGGEQHGDAHRAVNPMRELPVLLVDDQPIAQSMAILEYLEDTHPTPALLPSNALDRSRIRQMAELINSGIQPIQNLRVMQRLGREFGLEKPAQMTWSKGWIEFGFDALHTLVDTHRGRYTFGDEITLADICLIPQIYNARRFSVDMSRYPHFLEIEAALSTLQPFIDAHPDAQPDAVLT